MGWCSVEPDSIDPVEQFVSVEEPGGVPREPSGDESILGRVEGRGVWADQDVRVTPQRTRRVSGSGAKTSRARTRFARRRARRSWPPRDDVPRPTLTTVMPGLTLANTSALTALALTAMEESVSFHP